MVVSLSLGLKLRFKGLMLPKEVEVAVSIQS
jgi:hypothetical protein